VPRSRPRYPDEFRHEAIELVRTSGEPIPKVAKDLGISDQTLRNCVRQADVDAGRREGLTTDEREELRHRVSLLCRVLEVSRSGFYAFERRAPCQRRDDSGVGGRRSAARAGPLGT
jgi:transposase